MKQTPAQHQRELDNYGYLEGEVCGRSGCAGIIEEKEVDGGCSCHIVAPCSYCETPKEHCPECDWDAQGELESEEHDAWLRAQAQTEEEKQAERRRWKLFRIKSMVKTFDPNRINSRIRSHSNASQIVEGWFPAHMTQEDVRKHVNGTFGGRFTSFNRESQTFKFVAYTD